METNTFAADLKKRHIFVCTYACGSGCVCVNTSSLFPLGNMQCRLALWFGWRGLN